MWLENILWRLLCSENDTNMFICLFFLCHKMNFHFDMGFIILMFLLPTFRAYTHYIFSLSYGTNWNLCCFLHKTKLVIYDPKLWPHVPTRTQKHTTTSDGVKQYRVLKQLEIYILCLIIWIISNHIRLGTLTHYETLKRGMS